MKAPLQLLPLAALLALPATLRAQNELSNFTATGRGGVVNTFATDYQAIGINPRQPGPADGFEGRLHHRRAGRGPLLAHPQPDAI